MSINAFKRDPEWEAYRHQHLIVEPSSCPIPFCAQHPAFVYMTPRDAADTWTSHMEGDIEE